MRQCEIYILGTTRFDEWDGFEGGVIPGQIKFEPWDHRSAAVEFHQCDDLGSF